MSRSDAEFMRRAIQLSKNGYPAPNPRVGCVIVSGGEIVGEGFHESAGLPHAEAMALMQAGERADAADVYVTLEPCSHHGKTPPCADSLAKAGVARVVFAVSEPNAEAAGGAKILREKGLNVQSGLLAEEAAQVNRMFLKRHHEGLPYVTLKAAITLDGKITTASGESKWITGEEARKRAHELRAEHGCVLIGSGTAKSDNPALTVRNIEVRNQPLRAVLDPVRCLPGDLQLFSDEYETVRFVGAEFAKDGDSALPMENGLFKISDVLQSLALRGVIGVLVEGGAATHGEFLRSGLVDSIELHIAPKVLGAGLSWIQMGARSLSQAAMFRNLQSERMGEDIKLTAEVVNCSRD